MELTELRALTNQELTQKEKAIQKELFDLNYHRKMGRVEKPHKFSELKHDIARIMTIIKERELGNNANTSKRK